MALPKDILQNVSVTETYPRALGNPLLQIYSRASLSQVGGEREGQILKSSELLAALPEYPFPKTDPTNVKSRQNYDTHLPDVTAGLLIPSTENGERYLTSVGAFDYQNIPRVADMMARNDGKSQVAIRIVFGGSEEIQFRALSMLLPALQQVENIGNGVKPPQLQVVFANNIASYINKNDLRTMREQTRLFVDIAEAYTETFFPQASPHVVFLEDAPITDGSLIKSELHRLGELAEETLPQTLRATLQDKASDKNGKSILYAAAHLLMHDTNQDGLVLPITTNHDPAIIPDVLISEGGRQEADFYATRFVLKSLAGDAFQLPTVQFITKHKVPPYMSAEKGDINLENALGGITKEKIKAMDPLAVNDLVYLHTVSRRRGDIDAFIREFLERRVA